MKPVPAPATSLDRHPIGARAQAVNLSDSAAVQSDLAFMAAQIEADQPAGADVSIVIPRLNERANLESLLEHLRAETAKLGLVAEVIVVDGDSHHGTHEMATAAGVQVIRPVEPGYGAAILAGFSAASA